MSKFYAWLKCQPAIVAYLILPWLFFIQAVVYVLATLCTLPLFLLFGLYSGITSFLECLWDNVFLEVKWLAMDYWRYCRKRWCNKGIRQGDDDV